MPVQWLNVGITNHVVNLTLHQEKVVILGSFNPQALMIKKRAVDIKCLESKMKKMCPFLSIPAAVLGQVSKGVQQMGKLYCFMSRVLWQRQRWAPLPSVPTRSNPLSS